MWAAAAAAAGKPAHFESEFDINDFPQHARWKVTHKDSLARAFSPILFLQLTFTLFTRALFSFRCFAASTLSHLSHSQNPLSLSHLLTKETLEVSRC